MREAARSWAAGGGVSDFVSVSGDHTCLLAASPGQHPSHVSRVTWPAQHWHRVRSLQVSRILQEHHPQPAGEQQTPRLFKDWVSVSAGTQITNCSSHTFLRPRPGWRQLVRRTSIFHLTQRSLVLGSAMSSIAGLHSCIASHKCP